jgi:hypothetical protein
MIATSAQPDRLAQPEPPPPPPPPFRKPLTIDVKPTRQGQKTRRFRADLLSIVVAPRLWNLGATTNNGNSNGNGTGTATNTLRPIFLAYAATEAESRAFTANLRTGRPAAEEGPFTPRLRLEIPRSAATAFRFETHSRAGAALTVAYLPSAVSYQPASAAVAAPAEASLIRFLFMPPTWWVDREAAAPPLADLGRDARDAALAAWFVAYLDRRTPLPIANDPRFHLELYRAALATGWCHQPERSRHHFEHLYAAGTAALGLEPPVLVSTTHAEFSAFLAEQTARHLPREQEEVPTHGTPRIASAGWLLPDAAAAPAQPGLAG